MKGLPINDIRNTWQRMALVVVYRLTWVMYTIRCSSESVVSSYLSMVKFFQLEGRVASMMLGMKEFFNCNNCLPRVLKDGGIAFRCTLRLMA